MNLKLGIGLSIGGNFWRRVQNVKGIPKLRDKSLVEEN